MSVLVKKDSNIIVQGFTGKEGTFHAEQKESFRRSVPNSHRHTMNTILEEVVEHPQSSFGKAETRPADSRTSTTSESGTTLGCVRRGPSESFRWAAFSDRFDGLRIPSSPLHEF